MVHVPLTPVRHGGRLDVRRPQDGVVVGQGNHQDGLGSGPGPSAFRAVVPGSTVRHRRTRRSRRAKTRPPPDGHAGQQLLHDARLGVADVADFVAIPQATVMQREHTGDDLECLPIPAPRRGVPPDDLDHVAHQELAPAGDAHLRGPPPGLGDRPSGRVNPHVLASRMADQPLGKIAAPTAPQIQDVRCPRGVRPQTRQRPANQEPLDGVVPAAPTGGHTVQLAPAAGFGDVAVRAAVGHGVWGGKLRVTCADSRLRWDTPVYMVKAIAWVAPRFNRLAGVPPSNTAVACVLGVRLCLGFGRGGTARIQATWGLRPAVFALLWVAHKTIEDTPLANKDMAALWRQMTPDAAPCRTGRQWNRLEAGILVALGWRAHVKPALYTNMARALGVGVKVTVGTG